MKTMDRQQFEQLVQAAFQEIPLKFKKLITNVAIIIEDLSLIHI